MLPDPVVAEPADAVGTPAEAAAPLAWDLAAPEAFLSRELSWLGFARRVIALAEAPELPLLERVKFAGISGMLHDEFFMKRISGLKRQIRKRSVKRSLDGRLPQEELDACGAELREQVLRISAVLERELRPALAAEGVGIHDYPALSPDDQAALRDYFAQSVLPILTPLAVDPEHPFPFISNLGLNLAVLLPDDAPVQVTAKIDKGLLAVACILAVNHPLRGAIMGNRQLVFDQSLEEFSPEHLGQGLVAEEISSGFFLPQPCLQVDACCRYDHMDVGMIIQGSGMGMEDGGESW